MKPTTISVDRDAVLDSFRQWQTDQASLDAQVAESVAALEAYQSHLDAWQQELAREREELRRQREELARSPAPAGANQEQFGQVNRELIELRQKTASLTSALLARTEELRELDRQRSDLNAELTTARLRAKELTTALTAQQQASAATRRESVERTNSGTQAPAKPPGGEAPKSSKAASTDSPVLGSVIEQFGKLRLQRSLGRSNPQKPR